MVRRSSLGRPRPPHRAGHRRGEEWDAGPVADPSSAFFDGQDALDQAIRLLSADVRASTNLRPVITVRIRCPEGHGSVQFRWSPVRSRDGHHGGGGSDGYRRSRPGRHDRQFVAALATLSGSWSSGAGRAAVGTPAVGLPGDGNELAEIGQLGVLRPVMAGRLDSDRTAATIQRTEAGTGHVRSRSSRSADG